ncbi:MAG: serine/threonine protein kinase [Deltaproteobacteria bacterium]|nr:serine/threonine protein kinase [Deltaproteobacteria bacterium]
MLQAEHTPDDPFIGTLVDDRYRVLERVGQGGMGVVYRVEHTRMGKVAALKILHRRLCNDPTILKRFKIEAEAISRLNHPNIVQVFDFGQVSETPYLVMEYLHGESLGAILRRDGPLSLRRSIPLFVQICDALTEAHELGIVHRDLKPENIQVSRTRAGKAHLKVLDFGLAKIIETAQSKGDSVAGGLVGTPYYMAPELIRGQSVDHRSDIYAMGAMIYRVITGKHVFNANSPLGVLTRHITEDPVPPSETAPDLGISAELDSVVAQALAKLPDERFNTIVEMRQALVGAVNRTSSLEVSLAEPVHLTRRQSDSQEYLMVNEATLPAVVELTPPRLTRADLAFERKLRRSHIITLVALLGLFAVGLAVGYRFFIFEPARRMPNAEVEPNNETASATPLAPDKMMKGTLGKRLAQTTPDRDWYRIEVSGEGVQALSAHVTRLPNIDLCLEVYDHLGEKHVTVDSTGVAGDEVLVRWPVQPGRYYLLVREVFEVGQGRVPTENVTDAYTLKTHVEAFADEWEREPNDELRAARVLEEGASLKGHLGHHQDRDLFKILNTEDKLQVTVTAIPGVDLVLTALNETGKRLHRADEGGVGKGEVLSLPAKGGSCFVQLERKVRKKQAKGLAHKLVGVDTAYSLHLKRK